MSRLPVNVRPSTVSKETRGLERKTQALKLETGALDTRITSAEGELNALTPRVSSLEVDLVLLTIEVTNVEAAVNALTPRVTAVENRASSLEAFQANITPRVVTLESTVASLFPTTKEELVLASAQVIVTFSTINASESVFYIGGYGVDKGRLHDSEYTVDSSTQITLAESYPAGTTIFGVKNDR